MQSSVPLQPFPEIQHAECHSEEAVSEVEISPPPNFRNFDHWTSQKTNRAPGRVSWANTISTGHHRARQKSLSEAWHNIRGRRGSVTENAHEIADALKAPVSPVLVLMCIGWFMTSIVSNASSKSILIAFRYPVTLTIVQFAFVSSWCVVSSLVAQRFASIRSAVPALRHSIRRPSKELIRTTLPLTMFQIGGHILNSDAMARIPVSLVHTIKGLSPLFTVIAYRLIFRVHYSIPTYLSLIPLTLGVVMACSANVSSDFLGLLYAFGSAVLFVTQNIVSKRLFNEAARAESETFTQRQPPSKPDKLNLLCYSTGLALLFTFPIWLWSEGTTLLHEFFSQGSIELSQRPDALDHGRLALEFFLNGTFHYTQSLVAFILLSWISPVTYSVASLIKRVFVIAFAIVWFGNPMTRIQGFGIGLTFLGLYLYDRTNDAGRADKRARALQSNGERPLLPVIRENNRKNDNVFISESPMDMAPREMMRSPMSGVMSGVLNVSSSEDKRREDSKRRPSPGTGSESLLPGTKQEETWISHDLQAQAHHGSFAQQHLHGS